MPVKLDGIKSNLLKIAQVFADDDKLTFEDLHKSFMSKDHPILKHTSNVGGKLEQRGNPINNEEFSFYRTVKEQMEYLDRCAK